MSARMSQWKPGIYTYVLVIRGRLGGNYVTLDGIPIGNNDAGYINSVGAYSLYFGDIHLAAAPKWLEVPEYRYRGVEHIINPLTLASSDTRTKIQAHIGLPKLDQDLYTLQIECLGIDTESISLILIQRTKVKI